MTFRLTVRGAAIACALAAVACGGHAVGAPTSQVSSALPASMPTASAGRARISDGSWTQFDANAARTGVGPSDTGITASNAGSLRLRSVTIDGVVDSAPIALHGIRVGGTRHDLIAVTTSYGTTEAVDAGTGRRLWEFRPLHVNSTPGNPQVTTATPIADASHRFIYTASPNGFIHKLAAATGRQRWSARVSYNASHEKLDSALTITGRWLVVVTAGYFGDAPPYDAHIMLIDRATGRTGPVWNTECSNLHRLIVPTTCPLTSTRGGNAIWGRAGVVIEPGTGRILLATGNGPFDGSRNWGDSVLEFAPDTLRLLHNWTPTDQVQLDHSDTDLGSTSPALLPAFGGRRLAVQGGKDGKLRVLDLDRLDGTTGGAGARLGGELSVTSTPGANELLTAPAVWSSRGRTYVFVADDSGTTAYQLVDPAHPRLATVWSDATAGTSPVIAGGLLYVFDPSGSIAVRRPQTGALVRSLPSASGHWNSPIVIGGRVIEPTGNYHSSATSSTLEIYHLPGH
ncbi:MAG: PQQ-binding-like beta-propeller repeat protein [Solirubrobacteraceae bacterium]